MTGSQRLLAIAIAGTMLLGGFAFGRLSETPKTNAEDNKLALNSAAPVNPVNTAAPVSPTQAASENQSFFLSDYKTGYADGFNAVANNQTATPINTTREGYNEGYKQGIADAYQANANPQTARAAVGSRVVQQQQVFRPVQARRSGRSKLKTVLTIAAPAAIGAGIGAAAGGGKGAAAGALIGGGGGALYELLKNRNRN
jgi:hypothetical protein